MHNKIQNNNNNKKFKISINIKINITITSIIILSALLYFIIDGKIDLSYIF